MKIILEFDSEQEKEEALLAIRAVNWKSVVWELDQKLKTVTKYNRSFLGDGEASDIEFETVEKIRGMLHGMLADDNLSFD